MDTQERKLRQKLNRNGYTLRKKDSGYQIGDKDTNAFYLGLEYNATLDGVIRFTDNIDEAGCSDSFPYTDGMEESLYNEYLECLHMDISNLTRHMETLSLKGKHGQSEEIRERINKLEEILAGEEELDEMEREIRALLETHGYLLEKGIYGYRLSVKVTGEVLLGKMYDAGLEDAAEFATSLVMR